MRVMKVASSIRFVLFLHNLLSAAELCARAPDITAL